MIASITTVGKMFFFLKCPIHHRLHIDLCISQNTMEFVFW